MTFTFRGGTAPVEKGEKPEKGWREGVGAGSTEVPFQPDPCPALRHRGPFQVAFLH